MNMFKRSISGRNGGLSQALKLSGGDYDPETKRKIEIYNNPENNVSGTRAPVLNRLERLQEQRQINSAV